MDRRPAPCAIALCLALLPLACAQQRIDGTSGSDARVAPDAQTPDAAPDAQAAPGDGDASGGSEGDAPPVDPPDAGLTEDVASAPWDISATPTDLGAPPDADLTDAGASSADTGPRDTGPADTGPADAGPADAGPADAGVRDAGPADTGPRCVAPLTACGAGACVDLQTSAAHCGACGRACAVGASCATGRCVGGVIAGAEFRVGLTPGNCATVAHGDLTGDDRGGIAVSQSRLFYSGDTSTGRFDLQTLVGEAVGRTYDALVSNLATGAVYTLANGSTPLSQAGGTVTSLVELHPTHGGFTSGLINLSQPIALPAAGADVGIFSGYGRIVLVGGGRAWHVGLPGGAVIDLGAFALPSARVRCDSWAIWGVAEFFGGALYVDYVQSATAIARLRVPQGTVATLASFRALGDMCSFTVSPLWRRWYFHHEGPSQFRAGASGDETVGYCDATIAGPALPCRPTEATCAGACVDLQTSAAHCGACGRACAAGEGCTAGACVRACPAGRAACAGGCVELASDPSHCGTCGRTCVGGQWCTAGACVGGPYYAVDTAATLSYLDACSAPGSQRILANEDDRAEALPLPFATRWWGALLAAGTPMAVATNGAVQVGGASGRFSTSGMIPSVAAPNGVIAPQWRDLVMRSTGACVATLGAAPSRRWVAQWVDARYYAEFESHLDFEVIVHEGSGVVEFAYGAMAGLRPATVGLENSAGTEAVGGCGSTTCSQVSNSRVRFTPIP